MCVCVCSHIFLRSLSCRLAKVLKNIIEWNQTIAIEGCNSCFNSFFSFTLIFNGKLLAFCCFCNNLVNGDSQWKRYYCKFRLGSSRLW